MLHTEPSVYVLDSLFSCSQAVDLFIYPVYTFIIIEISNNIAVELHMRSKQVVRSFSFISKHIAKRNQSILFHHTLQLSKAKFVRKRKKIKILFYRVEFKQVVLAVRFVSITINFLMNVCCRLFLSIDTYGL